MFALEELRRATAQELSCSRVALRRHPSNPRAIAAPSATGDRFMTTKPARSKCSTRRFRHDLRHEFVSVVDALTAPKAQREDSAEARSPALGRPFCFATVMDVTAFRRACF
jgi:hypothetical protein